MISHSSTKLLYDNVPRGFTNEVDGKARRRVSRVGIVSCECSKPKSPLFSAMPKHHLDRTTISLGSLAPTSFLNLQYLNFTKEVTETCQR